MNDSVNFFRTVRPFLVFVCVSALSVHFLFSGCSGRDGGKVQRRFDMVEHLMNDSTGQAYAILKEIDPASLSSRKDSAHYALLVSQARYKLFIDDTTDSLINIAVNYYSNTNDDYRNFLSYYYQGCIYNNSKQYQKAALSLTKAEILSKRKVGCYEKGLLYSQLGDVFFHSFDFDKAQYYFGLAIENYRRADLELYARYGERDMGRCLIEKREYNSSSDLFKKVLAWAESNNEDGLVSDCLINLATIAIKNNDSTGVKDYTEQYHEKFGTLPEYARFMSSMSEYYLSLDNLSLAKDCISKALECNPSLNDSISIMYNMSVLYDRMGYPDSALMYYRRTVIYQNKQTINLLKQPISEGSNDLYKTLFDIASLKSKLKSIVLILVLVVSAFVFIILFMVYMNERRKSEQRQLELVTTIREQIDLLDHSSAKSAEMHQQLRKLFRSQFADLNDLCTGFYDSKVSKRKKDEMYLKAESSIKEMMSPTSISDLDRMINSTFDNILKKLTTGVDWLEKRDIMLIRLYLAGFSAKSINVLTGETIDNVYKKKTRILSHLEKTNPVLYRELTSLL